MLENVQPVKVMSFFEKNMQYSSRFGQYKSNQRLLCEFCGIKRVWVRQDEMNNVVIVKE